MELIELHILQSFPVTCLNRDDVGAPKSAFFGGVQRARVSSQSWKRAIRSMARELQPGLFAGTRTRYVIRELIAGFAGAGRNEREAKTLAEVTADGIGKLDDVEKGNVKTLLYFSPMEMRNVVNAVLEADFGDPLSRYLKSAEPLETARASRDEKSRAKAEKENQKAREDLLKVCTKASKKLKDAVKDAADIALFGRMVADDHSLTVEGAAFFSHALSTHQAANEVEFFSAVDDQPDIAEEGAGAGHIGTLEFNSACYYRYVGLNLDLLMDDEHLAHLNESERGSVLTAFVRSALLAVPGARKNSMFGFNPPALVLGLRRRGHPLSLVNAYEKPIRPRGDGYVEPSKNALSEHLSQLRAAYGLKADVEQSIPPQDLEGFVKALVEARPQVEV